MDVKTLCLGALALGDATGYEIKKQFEDGPYSHFHQASFGSIYPSLGQLSDEGLVTCTAMPQEGKPDKKVYSITSQGIISLKRKLRKMPARDRIRSENMVMFLLADFVEDDHLQEIFDDYLTFFKRNVEYLKGLDEQDVPSHRQFIRGMGLAFYEAVERYMTENSHLLFGEEPEAGDRKGGIG